MDATMRCIYARVVERLLQDFGRQIVSKLTQKVANKTTFLTIREQFGGSNSLRTAFATRKIHHWLCAGEQG
jgi:hypothetical protein